MSSRPLKLTLRVRGRVKTLWEKEWPGDEVVAKLLSKEFGETVPKHAVSNARRVFGLQHFKHKKHRIKRVKYRGRYNGPYAGIKACLKDALSRVKDLERESSERRKRVAEVLI